MVALALIPTSILIVMVVHFHRKLKRSDPVGIEFCDKCKKLKNE